MKLYILFLNYCIFNGYKKWKKSTNKKEKEVKNKNSTKKKKVSKKDKKTLH